MILKRFVKQGSEPKRNRKKIDPSTFYDIGIVVFICLLGVGIWLLGYFKGINYERANNVSVAVSPTSQHTQEYISPSPMGIPFTTPTAQIDSNTISPSTPNETATVSTTPTPTPTLSYTSEITATVVESTGYTDEDLYYLAAAICMEAGGSSDEIHLLVGNVILNRVNSTIYPNSIYDVLTQYKQYGYMWRDGVSFPDWVKSPTSTNEAIIERCYKNAERLLSGERFCPENVLFQAEFVQGSGIYKEFPGFYFCYYG